MTDVGSPGRSVLTDLESEGTGDRRRADRGLETISYP
jgi:hypothetical protein